MHPQAALSSLQRQRPCSALAGVATRRPRRRLCASAVHAYQQGPPYEYAAAPSPTPSSDSDVADIVSYAKRRLRHRAATQGEPTGPVGDFLHKVRLAWRIFFPEQPRLLTPKEEGKHRLRMILVADRCVVLVVFSGRRGCCVPLASAAALGAGGAAPWQASTRDTAVPLFSPRVRLLACMRTRRDHRCPVCRRHTHLPPPRLAPVLPFRVGMNEVTMEAMRERIIGAVSPYVEIESPDLVEVSVCQVVCWLLGIMFPGGKLCTSFHLLSSGFGWRGWGHWAAQLPAAAGRTQPSAVLHPGPRHVRCPAC
jgi:septum formation topological specificity factor MinE